jgi:hypothetical protein
MLVGRSSRRDTAGYSWDIGYWLGGDADIRAAAAAQVSANLGAMS